MNHYFTARDGARIFYKDWGSGQPVVFSHGWPLNSDSWESQMMFLARHDFRTIAHDRRGHGRSTQTWDGNDMNAYADDLASLLEVLDLRNVVLVGFSTGGGEVVRYIGRHGTRRVAKLVLVGAVPPLMLRTPENLGGQPLTVFDSLRKAELDNRSQLYADIAAGPFFGFNRPGATPSPALIDRFVAQGLQASHRSTYECIAAFSETDFHVDLQQVSVPTLLVHGDDDQIVPLHASAKMAAAVLRCSTLKVYEGAPHGLPDTHKDRLNADLLEFVSS
ncbi:MULTISPECIES: alpha/beta fold hydrolase [unclassified Roseateles]|uniref:alpha/beta fold hydrolase n=1 Tax=unclassified Roseateles TaxID=2626991 RepID=UPI0007014D8B|nr:chloroperoxidase [Pelomonas sp. Root405]KRA72153.1 chloroperoxidase [Pelomonas sp. Root662]